MFYYLFSGGEISLDGNERDNYFAYFSLYHDNFFSWPFIAIDTKFIDAKLQFNTYFVFLLHRNVFTLL